MIRTTLSIMCTPDTATDDPTLRIDDDRGVISEGIWFLNPMLTVQPVDRQSDPSPSWRIAGNQTCRYHCEEFNARSLLNTCARCHIYGKNIWREWSIPSIEYQQASGPWM
ncbi:hypothetical protein A0H81_08597 [Grifola frondosa]|uniref:Uncharacterized protein n=1 Tax=Grifola frondosa TaxID=5627 RepID=A0A1C7M4N4_GRIFR|nr:hypothetical protein A0H81_08597 [Grifola frondosa]